MTRRFSAGRQLRESIASALVTPFILVLGVANFTALIWPPLVFAFLAVLVILPALVVVFVLSFVVGFPVNFFLGWLTTGRVAVWLRATLVAIFAFALSIPVIAAITGFLYPDSVNPSWFGNAAFLSVGPAIAAGIGALIGIAISGAAANDEHR